MSSSPSLHSGWAGSLKAGMRISPLSPCQRLPLMPPLTFPRGPRLWYIEQSSAPLTQQGFSICHRAVPCFRHHPPLCILLQILIFRRSKFPLVARLSSSPPLRTPPQVGILLGIHPHSTGPLTTPRATMYTGPFFFLLAWIILIMIDNERASLPAFIHLCRLFDAQPVGSTLTWLARPHAWSTVSESLLCSTA